MAKIGKRVPKIDDNDWRVPPVRKPAPVPKPKPANDGLGNTEASTQEIIMTMGRKQTGENRGYRKPKPNELADPNEPPVFTLAETTQLEKLAQFGTAEEFQKGFALFVRRLIVRGLENVPVPRTIKELQALADMCRKAEGLDKNMGNAVVVGGGLVRVGGVRRNVGPVVESVVGDSELTDSVIEVPDSEDGDTDSEDRGGPDFDDFEV